jgi:hypothetical protein
MVANHHSWGDHNNKNWRIEDMDDNPGDLLPSWRQVLPSLRSRAWLPCVALRRPPSPPMPRPAAAGAAALVRRQRARQGASPRSPRRPLALASTASGESVVRWRASQ